MLKKMVFMSRSVALLLAMYMLLSPVASAAAQLISIPNHKCGPTQALKAAGKSTNLLPSLRHHDGSEIDPKEYRSLSGDKLYYVADAKPDAKKTAELIAAEIKIFGVVKVPADCAKGNCADVDQLKKQVDEAKASIKQLSQQVSEAQGVIQKQQKELTELRSNKGLGLWWYLIAMLVALVSGLAGYKYAQHKYPGDLEAVTQQRDLAESSLAELRASWSDPGKVEARLAELRAPLS